MPDNTSYFSTSSLGLCGIDAGDTDKAAVTAQVSNLEALAAQTTDASSAKNIIQQAQALRTQLSNYNDWSSSWTPVALGGYDSLSSLKSRVDVVTSPAAYPVVWNAARGAAADVVSIGTLGIVRPAGQYDPVTRTYSKGGVVSGAIGDTLLAVQKKACEAAGGTWTCDDAGNCSCTGLGSIVTKLAAAAGIFVLLAVGVNAYAKGRGSRVSNPRRRRRR